MTARRRIVVGSALALLALAASILLLAGAVFGLANTSWGRRALEGATAQLTGGQVLVVGLAGHFPQDLRATRLELRDAIGTWATADDVHVIWSPAQLLHDAIHLDLVEAARLQIARAPQPRASSNEASSGDLPRITANRIALARVEMGAPLAGTPAVVSLQGGMSLDWPRAGAVDLRMVRADAPGDYAVKGWMNPGALQVDAEANEPAHGLLSGLAGLGNLGAVSAQLHAQGARDAPALQLAVSAGMLRAQAVGSVDWKAQAVDLDVTGSAPAMAPRADLHWQSVAVQAHVHGPLRGPDAMAQLRIEGLAAAGAQVASLHADVQGQGGGLDVHAVAEQVRIPGPSPNLLQAAPLDLRAHVALGEPGRPATFTLSHPLATVQGHGHATGVLQVECSVTVPQLAPFSALAGTDLQGRAAFGVSVAQQGRTTHIGVTGNADVTGGSSLVRGLLGTGVKIDAALAVTGRQIDVERARIDGANLQASVTGTRGAEKTDLRGHAAIARLAALSPQVSGDVQIDGHLEQGPDQVPSQGPDQSPEHDRPGKGNALRLQADARGTLGTPGFASRPVEASLRVSGLPDAPVGTLEAHGTLEDAPLSLAATLARRPDGDIQVGIERADWKSAHAQGDLVLRSGAALPEGRLALQVARLADLAPGIDPELRGSAAGSVELSPAPAVHGRATIALDLSDAALAGSRADHLRVTATIDDPAGRPALSGEIQLQGLATHGVEGSARLVVKGPLPALKLDLMADLRAPDQSPAKVTASAVLDTDARRLALATLQAQTGSTALQLLAPAHFAFRDGIAVDRLRVAVAGSVLDLSGRVEPVLDLTASVRTDPGAGKAVPGPSRAGKGGLAVDARFTGNLAQSVLIDAKIAYGGQAQLIVSGTLPIAAAQAIDLHARGPIDAAIANTFLAATGRRLRGQLAVDLGVGGTVRAPRITGTARMTDATFEDDNLGAHLTHIDALVTGSGAALQITRLTAQAGPGTLSLTGTVGLVSSDLPVDVQLTARNAQPIASDFVVANLDADVRLHGVIPARLDATGTIKINRADVNIPNALPPSVGVLDVRRPGQAPAAPAAASATVFGLDLKVDAPGAVFVRGRGIDAELGGSLTIAGTSAAPQVSGGFDLRRGTFALAGSTLTFNSGRVGFNGTGLTRKIDPTLDFEAQSQSASFTATLDVTGYADAPKIALSSTPAMPQDEILAQLLFGTSVNKLTALQMVQIGSAFAAIGGLGSAAGGALSTVQKTLGLDRLSVGNTPTGATSVEAGRYVAKGVFVGARQMGTAGGTTQAIVQIDITKQLKAVGAFGNGGAVQGATPDNDPGNSIGLLYQIEY